MGSSYTLMTFLTSILLGLCMGSSVYFSIQFGKRDPDKLRSGIFQAFLLIGAITLVLNALVYALVDPILLLLQIPPEVTGLTKTYLLWVFAGIVATFLYNFFANLLRAVGNSVTPLFLGISVVLNIGLDLLFVVPLQMGGAGGGPGHGDLPVSGRPGAGGGPLEPSPPCGCGGRTGFGTKPPSANC